MNLFIFIAVIFLFENRNNIRKTTDHWPIIIYFYRIEASVVCFCVSLGKWTRNVDRIECVEKNFGTWPIFDVCISYIIIVAIALVVVALSNNNLMLKWGFDVRENVFVYQKKYLLLLFLFRLFSWLFIFLFCIFFAEYALKKNIFNSISLYNDGIWMFIKTRFFSEP